MRNKGAKNRARYKAGWGGIGGYVLATMTTKMIPTLTEGNGRDGIHCRGVKYVIPLGSLHVGQLHTPQTPRSQTPR